MRIVLTEDQIARIKLKIAKEGLNEDELDDLIEHLEKIGTNPFRYATVYSSIDHLVAELPYRPDVVGVMDRPDRLLRYGSWGMDLLQ